MPSLKPLFLAAGLALAPLPALAQTSPELRLPEELDETLRRMMDELKPALKQMFEMIESFEGDWRKEWFTYKPEEWGRKTHKVYDPQWKAPAGAKLALEVRAARPNKLVVGIDGHAAEVDLDGGEKWQTVTLSPAGFINATLYFA